jgi:hypothetical protein
MSATPMIKRRRILVSGALLVALTAAAPASAAKPVRVTKTLNADVRPPQSLAPAPSGKRPQGRSTLKAVAGYPAHSAHLECSIFNGAANLEGYADSADRWGWLDGDGWSNIYTVANQYIYFRMWVGRNNGQGGYDYTPGNWVRNSTGAPLNWEAYLGGAWRESSSGTYGILPFPVASYKVGSLSYVPIPRYQTRRVYFEWQWIRFDQAWRPTSQWAQTLDYAGDVYC